MNRRTFIGLAGASTAAVATAGCLSGTLGSTGSGPEEMSVDDVENLNVETTDRNTIEVQGVGAIGTEPNKAELSAAVEASDRENASNVVQELATGSEQLTQALEEYGIPAEDITTEWYSLGENSRKNRFEGEHGASTSRSPTTSARPCTTRRSSARSRTRARRRSCTRRQPTSRWATRCRSRRASATSALTGRSS
ncbi:hypothetical protein BRD08_00865 [Halobacteriales archaeon SW_10_66_29]|nr:MAG: hypothetical protein BRD08_00865 [Halobacteriales archaeon SW_10_66_29]